jgi:tRNA G18 (ribose-2'-O)-methylase SpoU
MMPLIDITDPSDPRIATYKDVRERDLVGREGRFIAEGETVLSVLLNGSRHRPESLLIADKRIEGLMPLIGKLEVPIYAASQAVIDAVAGFPLHRGILAVGLRAPEPEPAALLADARRVVVLFGIANHDNMGGIFRNTAAFGADAVLLDSTCCDPLYRKAIRVSVGGALKVPLVIAPPVIVVAPAVKLRPPRFRVPPLTFRVAVEAPRAEALPRTTVPPLITVPPV